MSEYQTVIYNVENRVATISLNRPQARNAFDHQLRLDLLAAILAANEDKAVRVVVIAGQGRGFSSGADLTENFRDHHDKISDQIKEEYKPFLLAIYSSPKIFISSIRGAAAGIGGALAMVCDLSIMAEDAYLYQAFAAIALVPDGGASWQLVNQLGYKRAFEMIVEAEKVPAETCLSLGLVNKVVASEQLEEETRAWAQRLAAGAPLAQRYAKEILQKAAVLSLSETIDLEAEKQDMTSTSLDAIEGAVAFFEKRKAAFSGE